MSKAPTFSIPAQAAVSMSALQAVKGLMGTDKVAQFDTLIAQTAIIGALALCTQPPKGYGNPADHAQLSKVFAEAKKDKLADHAKGYSTALRVRGFRSIADWAEACEEAYALAEEVFAPCAPKVKTKAEQAAAEARKAEKSKAAEQAKAEEERKAAELKAAELADAFRAGQAAAPSLTAETVADCIRAGAFTAEGLALIRAALEAAPVGQREEALAQG
jgi:flagellar biosynthesis GTPase FlhF